MSRGININGRGATISSRSLDVGRVIPDNVIENWEDGDTTINASGWSGWTVNTGSGTLTAQTSTAISGSYSSKFTSSNEYTSFQATRDSETTNNYISTIRIEDKTSDTAGGDDDDTQVIIADGSAVNLGLVSFTDSTGEVTWEGNVLRSAWSVDTNYQIEFDFDFPNDEVTIYINDVDEGTYALRNSASGWATTGYARETRGSGETTSIYTDVHAVP